MNTLVFSQSGTYPTKIVLDKDTFVVITFNMLQTINTEAILKVSNYQENIDSLTTVCNQKDTIIKGYTILVNGYIKEITLIKEKEKVENSYLKNKVKKANLISIVTTSVLLLTWIKILFF